MSIRIFRFFLFVIVVIQYLMLPRYTDAKESITIGVHPYLSATELVRRFSPLADYLGKITGKQVEIEIAKNYTEHTEKAGMNKLDIAFMGPASYVNMVETYGKKPLLARFEINGKPTFQGVIVVKEGSSIKTLKDLTGKRFAFGDFESTMGHLVPRYTLLEAGVRVENMTSHVFLANHNNIALGVLVGDYDAGAVKEDVYYEYEKRGLRELARTPDISEHLFITSSTLSPQVVEKLRQALLQLKDNEEGRRIMSLLRDQLTAMVPVDDGDYDSLRVILKNLEKSGIK